jgi:hypothetical protein
MFDYGQECYGQSIMPFKALVAGPLVTQTDRYESAGSHEYFLKNSVGRFAILSPSLRSRTGSAKNLECAGASTDRSSCFHKESS